MGAAQSGFLSLIPLAIASMGPTVDPPSLGPGYTAALQLHRVQPVRHRSLVPKRFGYCTFALDEPDYVGDSIFWRNRDQPMDVVGHQVTFLNLAVSWLGQGPTDLAKLLS